MEGIIFLIIVAYLLADALRTAWHIWSAEFVDAEVIGFKLSNSKWGENKVVLSFTSSEEGKQQLEMPFSLVPKPEGHQIKIWVKKGRKNYKYFLLFSLFFTLGIICWSVLFLLFLLPYDIKFIQFLAPILFFSGPILMLLGDLIDFKNLNRLPQIFFPKPTEKLSKSEYKALEKKAGLLSYEDMVNMRYYGLTRISTKLIAICGLIFFSYFIYSNWVDFQNSR